MNTTNNGDRLKAAAEAGDIDLLYTVIQDDPFILEMIDLIPFVFLNCFSFILWIRDYYV